MNLKFFGSWFFHKKIFFDTKLEKNMLRLKNFKKH